MNNLMHDIGSLSCTNAIVCNTTDTVDRFSLSLRILRFISKYKNVTRANSEATRKTGIQSGTYQNFDASFNMNKMFLRNI